MTVPLRIALAVLALILLLTACGGAPTEQSHKIVSRPGTPRADITPLATVAGGTPERTLPPRADPRDTVTPDRSGSTPDGSQYSRLVYTYTVGIRPVKLVLDIRPDGSARARFGPQNRAGTLPPDTIAAINAAMRATNFFALQDSYIPERSCCDLPAHEVTVYTADGRSKTVEVLGAVPEPLIPLLDALGGIWRELPRVE